MRIRPLTTIEECRRVAALEREIWGYTDAEDVVPPPLLIVAVKRGGILLGAYNEADQLCGFVYSVPGVKNGVLMQWSHMLGVLAGARASGIGAALKLAQRDAALQLGTDLIEWTYDPLQALNAHFNFAKLGVIAHEYDVNAYGESNSPLHRGSPTDRFVAEWHLTRPHVERRIASWGQPVLRDASIGDAPVVNPSRVAGDWLEPGDSDLSIDRARVMVEIPARYPDIQRLNPALALEWRLRTRAIFETYFMRGYRAVDFFLARNAARGHYLLSLPTSE